MGKGESLARRAKTMYPVCMATAMLIAGSVASAGGLAGVAIKKSVQMFGGR